MGQLSILKGHNLNCVFQTDFGTLLSNDVRQHIQVNTTPAQVHRHNDGTVAGVSQGSVTVKSTETGTMWIRLNSGVDYQVNYVDQHWPFIRGQQVVLLYVNQTFVGMKNVRANKWQYSPNTLREASGSGMKLINFLPLRLGAIITTVIALLITFFLTDSIFKPGSGLGIDSFPKAFALIYLVCMFIYNSFAAEARLQVVVARLQKVVDNSDATRTNWNASV